MKIWKLSCDIDNDELSLKNENNREILEEEFMGDSMAANWTPIPMYTSTKGVESDIVSWQGGPIPIILNEKAVHAIHD